MQNKGNVELNLFLRDQMTGRTLFKGQAIEALPGFHLRDYSLASGGRKSTS